jgi:hypothetical protein
LLLSATLARRVLIADATGAVKPARLTAEARSYQQLLQRR